MDRNPGTHIHTHTGTHRSTHTHSHRHMCVHTFMHTSKVPAYPRHSPSVMLFYGGNNSRPGMKLSVRLNLLQEFQYKVVAMDRNTVEKFLQKQKKWCPESGWILL